ncbi:glycoside hydrolase family 130 protein [bacterium]|nr:glycoside hydrolase family 130 protein [bacterium]
MVKDILKRYSKNPILTADDIPYKCKYVYNAGAIKYNGKYVLLLRTDIYSPDKEVRKPAQICLGLATSKDGYNFQVEKEPVMIPNEEEGKYIYDPRITQIDDTYYVLYANSTEYHEIRLGIASTRDFKDFERISLSRPDLRNGALFPEKINGYYVRLDRPFLHPRMSAGSPFPLDIWISYSPDLIFWGKSKPLFRAANCPWGQTKVGPGAPPVKTKKGWLEIFHGVGISEKGKTYRLGCMLLDLKNPSKIIGVAKEPILEPVEEYEKEGYVPNVVFTCGAIPEDNGELKIYYGGADACVCIATANIDDLISLCLE